MWRGDESIVLPKDIFLYGAEYLNALPFLGPTSSNVYPFLFETKVITYPFLRQFLLYLLLKTKILES